jgi:hypothetical protein
MDTCIIILSHADSVEKKEVLKKSLLQLKKLNLPILLSSHCPVEEDIQNETDYFLFDRNNPCFKESDFFNLDLPITEKNFNCQYFFSNICIRNYIRKETYQPSCFNHLISSSNFAKFLGFKKCLITDYDYIFNDNLILEISKIISTVNNQNHDGFFIPCAMKGIPTIFSVPLILPIDSFINYCGSKMIGNPQDYVDLSQFKIVEEWLRDFFETLPNPLRMNFYEYMDIFKDSHNHLIEAGHHQITYANINSGIFINRDDPKDWAVSVFNDTNKKVHISLLAKYNEEIVMHHNKEYPPNCWFFVKIPKEKIAQILSENKSLEVMENVTCDGITRSFQYKINNDNLETLKKCKSYYHF